MLRGRSTVASQQTESIGDNSPEEVAFKLFRIVGDLEGATNSYGTAKKNTFTSRKYLLDLYAECMLAVRMPHSRFREGRPEMPTFRPEQSDDELGQ
jgi:hypothetical protein